MKVGKVLLAMTLVVALTGCGGSGDNGAAIYNAGTQEVTVDGNNGQIKLTVTFSESKIEKIDALHDESAGIATPVFTDLIPEIIEKQSVEVETISGATVSSDAVIDGVTQAINAAKK